MLKDGCFGRQVTMPMFMLKNVWTDKKAILAILSQFGFGFWCLR